MKKGQKKDHILLPPLLLRQASRGAWPETLNELPPPPVKIVLYIVRQVMLAFPRPNLSFPSFPSKKIDRGLILRKKAPLLARGHLSQLPNRQRPIPSRASIHSAPSLPRPILIRISPAVFNLAETTKVD